MYKKKQNTHTKYYNNKGEVIPSCTTILSILNESNGLLFWANNLGFNGIKLTDEQNFNTNIGTLTHKLIEINLNKNINNEKTDFNHYTDSERFHALRAYRNFKLFKKENKFKPLLLEKELVSNEYNFGGTIDYIGKVGDVNVICDYKTSKSFSFKYALQLSGYRQLFLENRNNLKIKKNFNLDGVLILRLSKFNKGEYETKFISNDELNEYWELFKYLINIYSLSKKLDNKFNSLK